MGRKKLYEGMKCACCGVKPAEVKGYCIACYNRKNYIPKKINDNKRGPSVSDKTKNVIELIKEGKSQSQVAKIVGLSRQRVSMIVKSFYD